MHGTVGPEAARTEEVSSVRHNTLRELDRFVRMQIAKSSGGMSSISYSVAWFDWASHLAIAPGAQIELGLETLTATMRAWERTLNGTSRAQDGNPPFSVPGFDPLNPVKFLERYVEELDHLVDKAAYVPKGVSAKNRQRVRFGAHQAVDAMRPDNFFPLNADAIEQTVKEGGMNVVRGWMNWLGDMHRLTQVDGAPKQTDGKFQVGKNLAATPGKIVYRNHLIELIQYEPQTDEVYAEPILFVPAWIMKYYILDLSPANSLVKYLVSKGHTVFMISWRNPTAEDADLGFDDYRTLGVLSALETVKSLCKDRNIHAVGYCLGGTLLAISAGALARDGDTSLASVTLLAAQTDFRDPGELSIFIDEDQLEWLDASMSSKGFLEAEQMAGAFLLLRARELFWRRFQRSYLLGQKDESFDLSVWNEDTTRMPYKMHSEYLRRLFLHNDFVQGQFDVDGRPVAVSDIRAPIFALGTEKDHVAPWRSVFKINLFADCDVTFALTNGGHNAGVVSPPEKQHRHHRIHTKNDYDHYIGPDAWLQTSEYRVGSWWPSWADWLAERSSKKQKPAKLQRADVDTNELKSSEKLPLAPGAYIRQT